MTSDQAYITWKCTGRCDPALVAEFRQRRAAELALERLNQIVAGDTYKGSLNQ